MIPSQEPWNSRSLELSLPFPLSLSLILATIKFPRSQRGRGLASGRQSFRTGYSHAAPPLCSPSVRELSREWRLMNTKHVNNRGKSTRRGFGQACALLMEQPDEDEEKKKRDEMSLAKYMDLFVQWSSNIFGKRFSFFWINDMCNISIIKKSKLFSLFEEKLINFTIRLDFDF